MRAVPTDDGDGSATFCFLFAFFKGHVSVAPLKETPSAAAAGRGTERGPTPPTLAIAPFPSQQWRLLSCYAWGNVICKQYVLKHS